MKNILIGLFAFTFSNAIAQTVVFNATFDSGTDGFTVVTQDTLTPNAQVVEYTDAWIRVADPTNTTDTVMSSTSFFDPVGTADRWLISPQIALGAFGNSLTWKAKSHDASFPDDYYVLVSKTDNQPTSFTDTVRFVQEEFNTWTTRTVNLSDFNLDNQSVYIAFVNRTNNGFKLYIDDISVSKDDPASIQENTLDFSIFPNPAQNNVTVSVENFEKLTLFNSVGNKVMESEKKSIDVSQLTSGVYFIEVSSGNLTGRERLIKQ